MTARDIRRAYQACDDNSVHLACAFQRRHDAAYVAVADAVKDGKVGRPTSIRATFRDHPGPPAAFLANAGGNIFHDLATHDIDYVLALVKDVFPPDTTTHHHPDEVWAFGSSSTSELRAKGVFDAATIVLKWKRGDLIELCATLDLARGSTYGYDQRIEVFGTSGSSIAVDNPASTPVRIADRSGLHAPPHVHSFPQRFDDAFAAELDHFLDCVDQRAVPRVTVHDAYLATVVAEAALQSANHDTVVKLRRADDDVILHY